MHNLENKQLARFDPENKGLTEFRRDFRGVLNKFQPTR